MPSMPLKQVVDQLHRAEGARVVLDALLGPIRDWFIWRETDDGFTACPHVLTMERFAGAPVPPEAWNDALEMMQSMMADLEHQRDTLEATICSIPEPVGKVRDRRIISSKAARRAA